MSLSQDMRFTAAMSRNEPSQDSFSRENVLQMDLLPSLDNFERGAQATDSVSLAPEYEPVDASDWEQLTPVEFLEETGHEDSSLSLGLAIAPRGDLSPGEALLLLPM